MPRRQRPSHHTSGFHAEDGPQPLAAGKHAVAHGLVDGDGMLRLQRNQPVERCVGQLPSLFESFREHEAVQYNKAAHAGTARRDAGEREGEIRQQRKRTPAGVLDSKRNLCCGGSRERHAAQNRSQHIPHVIGRANIAGAGFQRGHPHFFVRNAMRADDGQIGKVAVQTLDIGQQPMLDIENHSFRTVASRRCPAILRGSGLGVLRSEGGVHQPGTSPL